MSTVPVTPAIGVPLPWLRAVAARVLAHRYGIAGGSVMVAAAVGAALTA